MAIRRDKLEKRAVNAALRASKKLHHIPNEEELRKLKIQVAPGSLRLVVLIAGVAMIFASLLGWPLDQDFQQGLLGIGGVLLVIFSIVGVRRTIGKVLDGLDGGGALLEGILTILGDGL